MPSDAASSIPLVPSRTRLLDAAIRLVRERFAATSIDDLCRAAGVTKGSFFHHFASKEELGVEAARRWNVVAVDALTQALWRELARPLERVLAYVDFRRAILVGDMAEFTCFAGTLVQEVHATSEPIRLACDAAISDGARVIEADILEALRARDGGEAPGQDAAAASLALHMQAVIQGALILAKAKGTAAVAQDSLDHLRRYLELTLRAPVTP